MNNEINLAPEELKILSVGNSFSIDTMEYLAEVAVSAGVKKVTLGNLYIGGCSINRHWSTAQADVASYKYYTNDGSGWQVTPEYKSSDAIKSEKWNFISIQHGTADGSRYTSEDSYANLPALVAYVKSLAWQGAKIAFNMAWVGETYKDHHEINSYNGDLESMYRNLTRITRDLVSNVEGIDIISPTGTAVQNARALCPGRDFTRDGFHLSYDLGRYMGALTFFKALTGAPISDVRWAPEGVSDEDRVLAIKCAEMAIANPFEITKSND